MFITVWGVSGEMPDGGVFSLKVLELTLVFVFIWALWGEGVLA